MNKKFTDHENKDSAVIAENIVHEPHHLEKLMKQNQDTLEMMGCLMKMLAGKAAHNLFPLFYLPRSFFFIFEE